MSDPAARSALVHFMSGDTDCLALVASLDYRVPQPPDAVEIDPRIAVQSTQALFVIPPMQAPFWRSAAYDAALAPDTWHWPDDHRSPPLELPPPIIPPPYVGEVVHYSEGTATHMAAIVINVADKEQAIVDLAVFNAEKKRTDYVYGIPKDQTRFGSMTWHRIRFEFIPEHHVEE